MINRKIIIVGAATSFGLSLGVLYAVHSTLLVSVMGPPNLYVLAGTALVLLGALFLVYAGVGMGALGKGRWLLVFVGTSGVLTGSASILNGLAHEGFSRRFESAALLLVYAGCLTFQLAVISAVIYFAFQRRSSQSIS